MTRPLPILCFVCFASSFLATACGKSAIDVPNNSSLLHVAKCPKSGHHDADVYGVELRGSGELRLWVDIALTQHFGAVRTETVYGRAVSDDVWAVLVHDYAGEVCEGYVAHDQVSVVGVLDPSTL